MDGTSNYKQTDAAANTTAMLVPFGRGASVIKSAMPEGLTLLSRFGNGPLNNILNKGVGFVNNGVENGTQAFTAAKAVGNLSNPNGSFQKWIRKNVGYRPQFN